MNDNHELILFTPNWTAKARETATDQIKYDRNVLIVAEPLIKDCAELSAQAKIIDETIDCVALKDKPNSFDQQDPMAHGQWLLAFLQNEIKKTSHCLIQFVLPFQDSEHCASLYLGLLRTLKIESNLDGQILFVDPSLNHLALINLCIAERGSVDDTIVRITGENRAVHAFDVHDTLKNDRVNNDQIPWQNQGVYVISGGMGGIGLLIALDIMSSVQSATVVLIGRAPKSAKQQELTALQTQAMQFGSNATIHYWSIDINDVDALTQCFQTESTRLGLGPLTGVIHCAGVIKDGYLINKKPDEIEQVLAPKIQGLQHLHQVTCAEPLDFFIGFSSLASITGNIGQAEYAFANGYLDGFLQWRSQQVRQAKAYGKSLSINWPLWADGGMIMSQDAKNRLYETSGIVAMDKKNALKALYMAMAMGSDHSQIAVTYGNSAQCYQHITRRNTAFPHPLNKLHDNKSNNMGSTNHLTLTQQLITAIKALFAQHTGIAIKQIDAEERFELYGIDSIMVARLNDQLAEYYTGVPKSIFYQCPTIKALADYLLKNHDKDTSMWLGNQVHDAMGQDEVFIMPDVSKKTSGKKHKPASHDAIAIIGMSGRFPQAQNIDEFWNNLVIGKNCISEIPSDRWSLADFYVSDKQEAVNRGKSYSKWGGFLHGFADFDPLFFNISPKEALDMDPQERLFLESCYCTLEQAGVTKVQIQKDYNGELGVFAGVTKTGFERYAQDLDQAGSAIKPRTSFSSVANRVSYFLDANGPSIPVDTMCSSSLTAIHQACESLQKGECQLALAGGVNLYQHPHNYFELCASGMLSEDGLCRSFGEGGTGFVPGEGVASVLLKPLSLAQKDGDNILAVIRSSAINHGGHAQGFTVPNPQAQSQLIEKVLSRAELSSQTISYVEAHGTGTQLGDPIEFEGLKNVFESDKSHLQKCHLGSVKSNIGHLEAAAGITGLIKTVLQIQHQQLVPSLHAKVINRHIDFNSSPFTLVQNAMPWRVAENQLRTALVSSFGAGGSNACVMIEEYPQSSDTTNPIGNSDKYAIILSARTKNELHKMVSNHLDWLMEQAELPSEKGAVGQSKVTEITEHQMLSIVAEHTKIAVEQLNGSMQISEFDFGAFELQNLISAFESSFGVQDISGEMVYSQTLSDWLNILQNNSSESTDVNTPEVDLMNLAYTLQTGRQPLPFRLAMNVESTSQLQALWQAFLNDEHNTSDLSSAGYFYDEVTAKKETLVQLQSSPAINQLINRWIESTNFEKMLPLWVKGLNIAWHKLYQQRPSDHLRIINLPNYPFTKQRLWPADALPKQTTANAQAKGSSEITARLSNGISSEQPAKIAQQEDVSHDQTSLAEVISLCVEKSLMIGKDDINPNQAFADYGLDSILSVGLVKQLNEHLSIDLKTAALFDYPSINQLAQYIEATFDTRQSSARVHQQQSSAAKNAAYDQQSTDNKQQESSISDVAIVGMSGCFPGAENVDELWQEIIAGHHHITDAQRWPLDTSLNACTQGGFLNEIAAFDAMFFNISGIEATHMDPQQRLFLQQVWTALEDAGYAGNALSGQNCGVYVGCCNGDYQDLFPHQPSSQSLWGNMGSVIPSRIAYLLDLKGPALAIDTSCSSSLVAVHSACQDLRRGDTDVAIAGGVFVQSTAKLYLSANKANMLSPTGATYSFDERADGFVPGEAAGVLLLKRLDDALADGDHIHAVIKGSGLNNDGATNGITAPSAESQASLLTEVYQKHGINVQDIDYIETHGTGTQLGDPIEFRALLKAFDNAPTTQYCTLGSVKQNIGHTQFAAGVSGIIKVILALKNQQIPPAVNFKKANKDVPIADSPFLINTQAKPWNTQANKTRLAGVSSFGASGTNAHVIIAEPPITHTTMHNGQAVLIVLSARSLDALKYNAEQLRHWCENHSQAALSDVSFTLMAGRGHFEHRLAIVVQNLDELKDRLAEYIHHDQNQTINHESIYQAYVKSPSNLIDDSLLSVSMTNHTHEANHNDMLHHLAASYIQGSVIDHQSLFDGQMVKRIPLPTYGFAKDRYWVKTSAQRQAQSQVQPQPLFTLNPCHAGFHVTFAKQAYVFQQHKVNGQSVLPGVMSLELLRSVIAIKSPTVKKWQLNKLVWVNPVLKQYHADLYLKIKLPEDDSSFAFELRSSRRDDSLMLTQGTVNYLGRQERDISIDLETLESVKPRSQWSAQQCYELTEQQGLQHGQMMRSLRKVIIGEDYGVAELNMPDQLMGEGNISLQPCILDSVILMSVAFLLDQGIVVDDLTSVPFMVEKFEILGDMTATMWAKMPVPLCHAQGIDGAIAADVFDDTGKLCIRMQGCFYRPVSTKKPAQMLMPHWRKISRAIDTKGSSLNNDMTWVMSTSHDPSSELLNHFPAHLIIDQSITQAQLQHHVSQADVPKQVVILALPAMPDQDMDALIDQHNDLAMQVLTLIKMMVAAQLDAQVIQWTLVTQNTHMIMNDTVCNPTAAGLHGLIGSMSKEFALWSSRIVDLESLSENILGEINALPISTDSCSLAHRNHQWYQSQLVPFELNKSIHNTPYKKQGLYLVIGGAGGVGRTWSKLVAASHQVQLIWVGRSAINDQIKQYIDEIALDAPRPIYIQADASDYGEMLACSQQVKQIGHLDGIVHSAISLNDHALMKMDREQFIQASQSKVEVSIRLAQCFDLSSLDFIVFFSSIQSFAKMPGQSNYAAGCTFEDSYCHYLRTQGINAKTINWGYWAQVGVVASAEMEQRMKKLGLLSLDADDLSQGLDTLLGIQIPQLAMVALTDQGSVETLNNTLRSIQSDRYYDSILDSVIANIPNQQDTVDQISAVVGDQMSAFDHEMAQLMFVQLNEAGLFNQQSTPMDTILSLIDPLYEPWMQESIRVLIKHGYLQWASDEHKQLVRLKPPVSSATAWQEWSLKTKPLLNNPDIQSHIILAETMMFALSDIVVGATPATDIMFPESSLKLVEGVYRDNKVADYFNQVLCETLVISIKKHLSVDAHKKIRILEVGAGTGGTAKRVFAALKPYQQHIEEYCYTDLSKAFLIHAEKNYRSDAPYLRTCLFNADNGVTEQGIEAASYDFVIATNVIHATQNIERSIKHIKQALLTNGLFLLNELNDNALFSHLTFGLLEGWWNYDDPELRIVGSPALSAESWQRVLAEQGFVNIAFAADKAHHLGQQLIIAESNGLIEQEIIPPMNSSLLSAKKQAITVKSIAQNPGSEKPDSQKLAPQKAVDDDLVSSYKHLSTQIDKHQAISFLRTIVASTIDIPAEKIEASISFERYGVDSLLVLSLINALREHFTEISSVLLFEVNTLDLLSDYLIEHNLQELSVALGISEMGVSEVPLSVNGDEQPDHKPASEKIQDRQATPASKEIQSEENHNHNIQDIAIVGMSARFADADNLTEFWQNISTARDSIRPISQDRAKWQAYKDFDKAGFMSAIDEFDPLFFHLSPAEAEQMDPQERLFIQEVYHCFEEAGYAPSQIGAQHKVGVYVGIMNSHYAPHAALWSVANRVSYLMDLKGPSMAIDTACSSSLTAVHLAVESLRSGSADMVIAGGVNLIVDPQHLQILDDMSLLSPEARCKAFGKGGNGIAIGEGVGALLLRPLKDAQADGDHIHAIIKGTSLNAGGKSSSYTAPKASAQAQLLKDAWHNAKVQAGDVSYIEGHGTGTELGDPIEFEGLNQAFKSIKGADHTCYLGSVKTNIGHLESAAGMAGICKVVLQMQQRTIVPNLYSKEINPHIDMDRSPFQLVQHTQPWGDETTHSAQPLTAGVNSFGAGGANAHVVLQEYRNTEQIKAVLGQQIIVLSAQSQGQLTSMVDQLHEHLQQQWPSTEASSQYLANLAWTLQNGRDVMSHRLAFVCDDIQGLINDLENYQLSSNPAIQSVVTEENALEADEAIDELIKTWTDKKSLRKIAALWVKGYVINWHVVRGTTKVQRTSLPVYPFANAKYWINNKADQQVVSSETRTNVSMSHVTQSVNQTHNEIGNETHKHTSNKKVNNPKTVLPVIDDLITHIAELLKLPVHDIDALEPLENYGLDSVMVIKLMDRLVDRYGPLSKTLIFEYPTLTEFAQMLSQHDTQHDHGITSSEQHHSTEIHSESVSLLNQKTDSSQDIAIIGIAGRYPDADDLEQFWHNLSQGKDAVSTVPTDRWRVDERFSGADQKGGFIENAQYFDAAFFNMLPADAELSDPQERLFVEMVYHAIENSGYTPQNLTSSAGDHSENVGVYVGVMYEDYQLHGVEAYNQGQNMALSGSPASIANRVSYLFDFNGPSLAIDSMCSSSFSAIHLACQAIKNGDCAVAVAGGVNLTLHENKYRMLNIGGFSSRNGHCAAFGASGDGYVPAEGVGAVILKPLNVAEQDGDGIIGVIKGTALNHGGKSNGYTVPNAQAQASVIRSALSQSGISPQDINYIEAHGTGTVLGDPIEIEGLMQSYGEQAGQGQCAVGSVKSNIGHCESAAGMASLSKVLLQMKHQQLVPSLYAEPRNPHIDFATTPFDVPSRLMPWQPVYTPQGHAQPLRAGISSFGAGGVNSHMIIEQYVQKPQITPQNTASLLVLSARTQKALSQQVVNLYEHLKHHVNQTASMRNVCYTLQVGRVAMSHRLACVVDNHQQCLSVLQSLIEQRKSPVPVHQAKVSKVSRHQNKALQDPQDVSLQHIAMAWVQGSDVLWHKLYGADLPQRIALPAYPFERKAYWAPATMDSPQTITTQHQHEHLFIKPQWVDEVLDKSQQRSAQHVSTHHVIMLSHGFDDLKQQLIKHKDINVIDSLINQDDFVQTVLGLIKQLKSLLKSTENAKDTGDMSHVNAQIVQVLVNSNILNAEFSSLTALLKSINQESTEIHCQLIAVNTHHHIDVLGLLSAEAQSQADAIRYEQHRQVRHLQRCEVSESMHASTPLWQADQVFVISGGAGGLGWIFTQAIVNQVKQAKVVLLGRSALSQQRITAMQQLKQLGISIIYRALDVSDKPAMQILMDEVKQQYGGVDHVIHCAGVLRDGYLVNKSEADIRAVLAPKLIGVMVLDEVTKQEKLSSFTCFSSIAGVTGNAGQCDYALANGYLDGFAKDRNKHVLNQQRSGQTLSINWPLWQSDGMQMDHSSQQLLLSNYGLAAMPAKVGVSASLQAYAFHCDQIMIAYGDANTIMQRVDNGIVDDIVNGFVNNPANMDNEQAQFESNVVDATDVENQILSLVSEILRVDQSEVDVLLPLGEYGFDSISFTQLAAKVSSVFDVTVQPSDIFSYPTIKELSGYVAAQMQASSNNTAQTIESPLLTDHPLIDQRINDDLFSVTLTGQEALLTDHMINGDQIFPGTAYIEMALAARQMMEPSQRYAVKNINWQQLCVVNEKRQIFLAFADGGSTFKIYTQHDEEQVVHATGELVAADTMALKSEKLFINTEGMIDISVDDCYQAFSTIGVEYGQSHQSLQSLWLTPNGVLAKLRRHEASHNQHWIVNPMYLDGVLQASLALLANEQGQFQLSRTDVPFSLASVVIDGPLPEEIFVKVINHQLSVDFILCDHTGQVCGKLIGLKSYPVTLDSSRPEVKNTTPEYQPSQEAVAIIGMSGSFPQAENIDIFWHNLLSGKDGISEIPSDRWDWQAIYGDPLLKEGCTNIKWGGFMDNMSHFDYRFFAMSAKEAEILDPQQRLLMMHVYKAIEDAGYAPSSLAGSNTGLVIATVAIDYAFRLDQAQKAIGGRTALGNVASVGPNRMSYLLDIHGPSETVETACSSSLVALHRGVQVINNGESDMVIVGGINTISTAKGHIGFSQSGMLSPTGRCHAFSEKADGYARGEGVGMLVLKSLSAAQADGDPIHGVILGTGVNHGGKANSLTSPNPKAQSELIASVMKKSKINPKSISFIESHGTGTRLGDPIEIDALKQAYQSLYESYDESSQSQPHIAIGALKSHIGHLEMASGIAGVIKVLLQMKHKTVVGNLHCDTVNPYINFAQSPFYLNNQTRPWIAPHKDKDQQQQWPLRAGVSSFGFGGVNAHVVLENHQASHTHDNQSPANKPELLIVSAKSETSLLHMCEQLSDWIDQHQNTDDVTINLANMAWTLKTGRDEMSHRLACVVEDFAAVKNALQRYIAGEPCPLLFTGIVKRHNKNAVETEAVDHKAHTDEKAHLSAMAKQWVNGSVFDWMQVGTGHQLKRIHIPSYVFDAHKCWVDLPTKHQQQTQTDEPINTGAPDDAFLNIVADELGVDKGQLNVTDSFVDMGIDSITKMQVISRFNQMYIGTIDKDGSDYLLQAHTIADCLNYLKSIKSAELNKVPDEQSLMGMLVEFFEFDSAMVNMDTSFDELGIDSIGFIRFIAQLTASYPAYAWDKKSDALLLAQNIEHLSAIILSKDIKLSKARVQKKATEDGVSTLPTIKKIEPTIKDNPINHVVEKIEGTSEGKVFAVGLLRVDESHPYFFDHPLDHVSGMHLSQAMSDVTKASYLNHHKLPQDSALLIQEIDIKFPNTCNKEDESKVVSRLIKSEDNGDHYDAKITQNSKVVAKAILVIRPIKPTSDHDKKGYNKAHSKVKRDKKEVVEPGLVNKHKQANVLLTQLRQQGENRHCEVIIHPDAVYYHDFTGQHVDSLVLTEAVRQSLRLAVPAFYPDFMASFEQQSQQYHSFLKDISLKLNKPIYADKPIMIELNDCHLSETGSAKYFELSGDIIYDDVKHGSFTVSALMMSDSLLKKWTNTQ